MELDGYSRQMYNKLVHSATTRSTVVGVIHKLTVDDFVDNTCRPYTDDLLRRIFLSPQSRNYSHDPDPSTQGTVSHHKADTPDGQPVYKI